MFQEQIAGHIIIIENTITQLLLPRLEIGESPVVCLFMLYHFIIWRLASLTLNIYSGPLQLCRKFKTSPRKVLPTHITPDSLDYSRLTMGTTNHSSGALSLARVTSSCQWITYNCSSFDLDEKLILIKMPSPEHSSATSAMNDASSFVLMGLHQPLPALLFY